MQIRKDIPSKMYHYTSLESLCSIVENQEFWLGVPTCVMTLNVEMSFFR